jgi:predicted Zn-dependent protease
MRPFLLFLLLPVLLAAQTARTDFFPVKTWTLLGTWTYSRHLSTVEDIGNDTTQTRDYHAEVRATARFRLVQTKDHSSRRYRWAQERGAKPSVAAHATVTDFVKIKPKNGKESWDKKETYITGGAVEDGEASLAMEPMTGAYELHAGFLNLTGGSFKHTNSAGGSVEAPLGCAFSSSPAGVQGLAAGLTFGGTSTDGIMAGASLDNPAGNLVSFSWQLSPGDKDPEGEATFDYLDQNWLPEPDTTTTLEISWKGKAEKVKVTLSEISRQPGTCLNSKDEDKDEDLLIEKQGKWDVQKEGKDGALKYIAFYVLPKEGAPKSLELELKAKDYAPFGKLKCEILLDGKWQNATQKSTGTAVANVPYDLDGVHIAEVWKRKESALGLAATWDEAKVAGQSSVGDGLSLYEKYRGLYVGSGAGGYQRLKAREKSLLVVDENGLFDPGLWKAASGITAYLIPKERTQAGKGGAEAARIVNFRSEFAKKGDKFAVVVTLLPGEQEDGTCGEVNVGVASPRDVLFCRVYAGSITAYVQKMWQWLALAVRNPEGPEGQYFKQAGLPERLWKKALDRLDKTRFDQLVNQQRRWTALHEMGHACGLPGHTANPASIEEIPAGDTQCYMRYSEDTAGMRYIILQTLFKPDASTPMDYCTFCTDPYNCHGALNVNDSR